MATYKEAFNDKVNWKIFNMINDLMIEYEDKDYVCTVKLAIRTGTSFNAYITIYNYSSNINDVNGWAKENHSDSYISKMIDHYFNEYGVIYFILIETPYDEEDDNHVDKDLMNIVKEKLINTNKLEFVMENNFDEYGFKEKSL